MKIAIDGSHLDANNVTGTQRYLISLVKNLLQIPSENEYVLFTKYDLDTATEEAWFGPRDTYNSSLVVERLSAEYSWTQVQLSKRLFREKFAILLCTWQTMPVIRPLGLKVVSVIHDFSYEPFRDGPTYFTCAFSDQLIVVSADTRDQLFKRLPFINREKVLLIGEGVDTTIFNRRNDLSVIEYLQTNGFRNQYILFVGTLNKRKNLERLIQAFVKFRKKTDLNIKLVLVGASVKDYDLKSFITQMSKYDGNDLHKDIKFLGRVSDQDLAYLLNGALFLAFPSITEGFGLPILEAMACGTPVLTSRGGALVSTAGESAYFVDALSIDSIYKGINALATDAELRERFRKLGLEHVKKYSWKEVAASILKVFEKYD